MKEKIKRMLCFGLCYIVLLTTACSNQNDTKKEQNTILEEYNDTFCTISSKAKMTREDGIRYTDPVSAKNRLICNDVNCSHDDESCGAYMEGVVFGGLHREGKHLFYISDGESNKLGKCSLYEANLDGKNRKKITDLMEASVIASALYTKENVFIAYLKEDEESELRKAGIYVYNRKTKKGKVLYQMKKVNANVSHMIFDQGILYATISCNDLSASQIKKHRYDNAYIQKYFKTEIVAVQLEDGKIVQKIDGLNHSGLNSNLFMLRDHTLFYTSDEAALSFDLTTGKKKKIGSGERLLIFSDHKASKGLYYTDGSNYYQYDCKNNAWTTLSKCKSTMVQAIMGDVVYLLYTSDEELKDAVITRSDFEKGNFSKMKKVKTE